MRSTSIIALVLLCACVEKKSIEIDEVDEEIDTAGSFEGEGDTGAGGGPPLDTDTGTGGDTGDGPGDTDDTETDPEDTDDTVPGGDTGIGSGDTGGPGEVADEICNGIDDDGDGLIDEDPVDGSTYYEDADGDGYGDAGSTTTACEEPEGYSDDDSDCDDTDSGIHPDADDLCDGLDGDCDGTIDEDADVDEDGIGDCYDVEDCDAIDNDGDGVIDEDCEDDCIDYDTEEDCLTWWQAHALGVLTVETDSDGIVTARNSHAELDVCLDEQALYSSDDTQAVFFDWAPIDDDVRIGPGEDLELYYGSYTTDNGNTSPYLGEYAWWCWEAGQGTYADAVFDYYGEVPPDPLLYFANDSTDEDGDSVEDHVDWADSTGVQTQHNIWDYQDSQLIMTVGKTAAVDGDEVTITITTRNIGYVDGEGTITDVVPAGWSVASISETPEGEVLESDGSTTLTFTVSLDGYIEPSSSGDTVVLDTHSITYTLQRDLVIDKVYQRFDSASIVYDDGVDFYESVSLPTAAYDVDVDDDGSVTCK